MSFQASLFARLALGASLALASAPALAQQPAKPKVSPAKPGTKADKAAADKAAADKAAADKAAADKAAADKATADAAAAEQAAAADKAAADKAAADKAAADKAVADKAAADKAAEDENDPYEEPGKTYRFIGLRYRDAVVPRFMLNWFADGGRTVNVPMVGPEFISRKDHLEIAIALMYSDYGMDPTLFKGKNNPDTDYELTQSTLKLGYLMVDLLYEIPLPIDEKKGDKTGRFALLVGGGVGIAGVFGSLYRAQAYPLPNGGATVDPGNPSLWGACQSATDPRGANGSWCANPNNHFWGNWSKSNPTSVGNGAGFTYAEPSWANGGSKPLIFPWIALPQISFRYKPIKQFQLKADFGFSTSGFFFGLSASSFIPSSSPSSSSSSSSSSSPSSSSPSTGEGSGK